jgi:4-hydroxy-3-polyprenylbenzoate decarboxylase
VLVQAQQRVQLIVSDHGLRLLRTETDIDTVEALRRRIGAPAWDASVTLFDDNDRGAAPASGSARNRGMVICPCSMGTISAISQGTSRSLVERAADVALKERRTLVLVPRETPYSAIHLENMLRLTRAGAVVLPASPGFYHRPATIDELVDFVVSRVLDHLGVEHAIGRRWGDEPEHA